VLASASCAAPVTAARAGPAAPTAAVSSPVASGPAALTAAVSSPVTSDPAVSSSVASSRVASGPAVSGPVTSAPAVSSPVAASPVSTLLPTSAASAPPMPAVGPTCRVDQLAGVLWSVANANTMRYGWIVIRDVSGGPCVLRGSIALTGHSAVGAPDTITVRYQLDGGLLLTANAPQPALGAMPPTGYTVGFLLLGDSYLVWAGPNAGDVCPDGDLRFPATFWLDFGARRRLVVDNRITTLPAHELFSCRGHLMAASPVTAEPN